jgi:hypothetical protein
LCTVVGLTTAPSFAQEGGLLSKQVIFNPRMGHACTESSDGPCRACYIISQATIPVLGGYPARRVITGGSGSGSCNPDPSWRQLVRNSHKNRMVGKKKVLLDPEPEPELWKNIFENMVRIYICTKVDFFQKFISRLNFMINYN